MPGAEAADHADADTRLSTRPGRPDNASFIRCRRKFGGMRHRTSRQSSDRPGAPMAASPSRRCPIPGSAGRCSTSRQRWRDFTTLAADLVFETDAEGRLTFVAPEAPLGWAADALLGRPGRELLAMPEPDPFLLRGAARGLRAWLRRPDGGSACLSLSLAPLHDSAGRFVGLRGCGRDISTEMAEAETQAARCAGRRRCRAWSAGCGGRCWRRAC